MTAKRYSGVGFTLVELLVVIGIIGLLISILLPALKKVQVAARASKCLSNMHNVAQNEFFYMAQHKGEMSIDPADGLFSSSGRVDSRQPYDRRLSTCPELPLINPADSSSLYGYEFSGWLAYAKAPPAKRILPARVKNSSQTVVFGDTYTVLTINSQGTGMLTSDGLQDPFFLQSTKSAVLLARPCFPGRHGGLGGVLWMDGHASMERPVRAPSDLSRYRSDYRGLEHPLPFYYSQNIGYLVRSADDLSSLAGMYYFAFDKTLVAQSDASVFFEPRKSAW